MVSILIIFKFIHQSMAQQQNNTPASASSTSGGVQPSPLSEKLAKDPHYYWFLVVFLVVVSALGSFVNDMYSPALSSPLIGQT